MNRYSKGLMHGCIKEAVMNMLPDAFAPDALNKIKLHASNLRPGDIPVMENGHMWGHGPILASFEILEDGKPKFFVVAMRFVPLVEIKPYMQLDNVGPCEYLYAYRPMNHPPKQ